MTTTAAVSISVSVNGEASNSVQNISASGFNNVSESVTKGGGTATIDMQIKPGTTKLFEAVSNVDLELAAGGDSLSLKAGVPYIFRDGAYETFFITATRTSIVATNNDTETDATLTIKHLYDATA